MNYLRGVSEFRPSSLFQPDNPSHRFDTLYRESQLIMSNMLSFFPENSQAQAGWWGYLRDEGWGVCRTNEGKAFPNLDTPVRLIDRYVATEG